MNSTDYLRSIDQKLDILISCVCPPGALGGASAGSRGLSAKKIKATSSPRGPSEWNTFVGQVFKQMAAERGVRIESFLASGMNPQEAQKAFNEAAREAGVTWKNALAEASRRKNTSEGVNHSEKEAKKAAARLKRGIIETGASAGKAPAVPHQTKELNEETGLTRLTIDGQKYWLSAEGNEVWRRNVEDELGAWVGYYQPDNAANPIRPTNAPNNAGGGGRRRKTRKSRKPRKTRKTRKS